MLIRAAVSRKELAAPVMERAELTGPSTSEILVRIVACGVCRTDLDAHAGISRVPRPIVLGHEGAGVIEEVGEGVASFAPGDRVVLGCSSCGVCRNCSQGLPSYCQETMRRNFGGLRPDGTTYLTVNGSRVFGHFFGQSSFAQYAVAHERSAVKVNHGAELATLAPLGCSISTGAGAVFNALQVSADDAMAIFGVGAVGLAAVMAARIVGAKRIIAVDRSRERLALALELGATDVLDATETEIAKAVRRICPNGVDFALNTTSSDAILSAAIEALAVRGVAGFVAAPQVPWTAPLQAMLSGGRTLRAILGSDTQPQQIVASLMQHHRSGRFPIERLITVYPFDEIQSAFDDYARGRAIKPVLIW